MMNDRALWYRAKPYLVDLEVLKLVGFIPVESRVKWRYCSQRFRRCTDEKLTEYVQPCLVLIDTARKQRWQQVEYRNVIYPLKDQDSASYCASQFPNGADLVNYYSLWKSLDTESILYLYHISGEGFICLDTKDQALVIGIEEGHAVVDSLDFIYFNTHTCAGSFDHFRIKPNDCPNRIEDSKGKKRKRYNYDGEDENSDLKKQFTMEEATRYLGTIDIDRVFGNFRKLSIDFLNDLYRENRYSAK
jgi:hypothetical protein